MKRKMKRFAEGDSVEDLREDTGQSTGIDEGVRARAMKFLQSGKKDEEESKPAAKTSKPAAKSSAKDTSDQNDRRAKQAGYEAQANIKRLKEYDKPLEESHPEDYFLPGVTGLLRKGASAIGKKAAQEAIEGTAKETTKRVGMNERPKSLDYDRNVANRRSHEGYSPEEAMAARKSSDEAVKESARAKSEAAKKGIESKSERTRTSGAMKDDFKPSEIRKGYKSGGMARTSSSRRGDGIATKGFTRGKYL
jgi:hypothetical protein